MIRVRYLSPNELSPGLHATAERQGRRTTVFLLDGMTAVQRRSALRRLRLTARMGHCPRLPAGQLGFALFSDRIRTGIRRAGAVLRLHPAGSTVPIMVLSGGAIAFLLFSTVSIHVLPTPRTADQSAAGASPVISASAIAIGGAPGQATGQGGPGNAGNLGGTGGQADPGGLGRGSDPRQLTRPGSGSAGTTPALAAGDPGRGNGAGSGSGSGGEATKGSSSSGGTTDSSGANPSQVTSQPSAPATTTTAPASTTTTAPAAAPTRASSSSGSSDGGVCVDVGSLGVCLSL
jgi:hypothetical protein